MVFKVTLAEEPPRTQLTGIRSQLLVVTLVVLLQGGCSHVPLSNAQNICVEIIIIN